MDNTSNNFFFGNQQFYIPQDSPASPCYTSQLSPFGLYDSLLLPNAEYSQSAPHTSNGSLADELAQMQQSAAQILQQSTVHQQQLDLLSFPELNLPYDNFPTTSTSSYPTGLSPSMSTSDQNQPARYAPQASSSTCANDAKDEEPLYVNAKQYHRIMHRRAARARLEEVHRLARERKVCLPLDSREGGF